MNWGEWFSGKGGVGIFSMVAEHRRSIGAMVQWSEPYAKPFLLLVILGVSMCLHEVWILDGSYVTDSDDFHMYKDVVGTVVDVTEEVSYSDTDGDLAGYRSISRGDTKLDLAGWYRSDLWKAVSGVSQTWNSDGIGVYIDANESTYVENECGNLQECEIAGCGTVINETSHVSAPDRDVPDLRAFSYEQIDSMLNDSHGVHILADIRSDY